MKRTFKERVRLIKFKLSHNWLVTEVVGGYLYLLRSWRFRIAKKKAKKWAARTHRRYYVVPISNTGFIVINNLARKAYNRKVGRSMHINFKKMDEIQYWHSDRKS